MRSEHVEDASDSVVVTHLLQTRSPVRHDPAAEVRMLAIIGRSMARSLALEDLLDALSEAASGLRDGSSCGISTLETGTGAEPVFRWAALRGPLATDGARVREPGYDTPSGLALRTDAPQLFRRPARHFSFYPRSQNEIYEQLVVPIPSGPERVGSLWVASHSADQEFSAGDASLLSLLAHEGGRAIQVAREHHGLRVTAERGRTLAERQRRLLEGAEAVAAQPTLESACDTALEILCSALDMPAGYAYVVDEGGERVVLGGARNMAARWRHANRSFSVTAPGVIAIREADYVGVHGAAGATLSQDTGLGSILIVRIRRGHRFLGFIAVGDCTPRDVGADDVALTRTFAALLAPVIGEFRAEEAARRNHEELRRRTRELGDLLRETGRARVKELARGAMLRHVIAAQTRSHEVVDALNRELEDEQRFWHSVLEVLPVGVWVFQRETMLATYCNSAGSHALRDVLARRDVLTIAPEDLGFLTLEGHPCPREKLPIVRSLIEGIIVQEELTLMSGGIECRVMMHSTPFKDIHGRITHAIVALYDVSKIHELETFRQQWTNALAHDIKTPLTASRLAVQHMILKASRLETPGETGTLMLLNRQIERVIRLLSLMLDVSRLTEGRLALNIERRPFMKIVGNVIEEWGAAFPDARIELETVASASLEADVDGDRIEELLGNLLSNAIKYSVSSHPVVKIQVECDGERVVTRVIDQGLGMTDEQARVIFDLYQRGGREHTDIGGEGLGAYVAYELARMHGGSLKVERTAIGEGTTLLLELPLRQAVQAVGSLRPREVDGEAEPPGAGGKAYPTEGGSS